LLVIALAIKMLRISLGAEVGAFFGSGNTIFPMNLAY
jgi:hypothetical protein